MSSTKATYSKIIKSEAANLGFQFCGIAKSERLEKEAYQLEEWLNQNRHGQMAYMANHFDLRIDPSRLVDGAKSVISLLYNYYPENDLFQNKKFKISKYAYGRDYHKVIRKKLDSLLKKIEEIVPDVAGRVFVDSAPVMEKVWAKRAGLGWVGKHTNLINKDMGSFFFLAEIIIDKELEYDGPVKDYCGTCTKCIDACPTDALTQPYQIDASKCISYLTIELKENIPSEFKGKMADWVFGCDICQDVCPWNSFSKPHQEKDFYPKDDLIKLNEREWVEMSEQVFDRVFQGSPVKRTKLVGLRRNIRFLESGQE